MTVTVLRIKDLMALFDCSRATVDRMRKDPGFPQSFTPKNHRALWVADAVYEWIQHQQSLANPPPINVPSVRQRNKETKDFQERSKRAEATLERHRLNRHKTKVGQES